MSNASITAHGSRRNLCRKIILSERFPLSTKYNNEEETCPVRILFVESGGAFFYDFLFQGFRAEKFSLIEFGCLRGDSLRMWEQYFPAAEIYGVDIDESTKKNEKGRVHIVIGDATSQQTYDTLKAETGGAFIILDDASHAWSDQRRSFELFWDIVTPGGFYVIEDLECPSLGAYPDYPPKVLDSQTLFSYIQDRCEYLRWASDRNPEENSYHFEQLPAHIQKIQREMDMCIFIPGTIIVRKKP